MEQSYSCLACKLYFSIWFIFLLVFWHTVLSQYKVFVFFYLFVKMLFVAKFCFIYLVTLFATNACKMEQLVPANCTLVGLFVLFVFRRSVSALLFYLERFVRCLC